MFQDSKVFSIPIKTMECRYKYYTTRLLASSPGILQPQILCLRPADLETEAQKLCRLQSKVFFWIFLVHLSVIECAF